MRRFFLIAAIFLSAMGDLFSQSGSRSDISFDGFYITKTGTVANTNFEMYTYLRFYKDGTVYSQTVTSNEPQTVSSWFGRYKKFSLKGKYQLTGSSISITVDNKDSKDVKLEGLQETAYTGSIKSSNEICLTKAEETKENCFTFYKVLDSTKLKYAPYKPEIKLPGEWKVKQVLNTQVFFTNDDSTLVAISVFKAARLPVYKESQTAFETAYAYYEWDSKYMKDEQKMEVKKIADNKEKAFVIWNAKDKYNDNYHLFARQNDLLYNIMIYDTQMPVDKQLKFIQMLYDLNKE